MKTLCEDTFKTLAGDGAYLRGEQYYSENRVSDLKITKYEISAQVSGTKTYHVLLRHTAKLFEGECNCPASNNFDFCKHCVAVSLKYYYQTQTNQELAESPEQNRLLSYLNTLTRQDLAGELHQLIIADSELSDHWQLKAEIASGGISAAKLRKRITKAIAYKPSGLWRYRDVVNYFEICKMSLTALKDPLFTLDPPETIKLITYALQRYQKTLETIDDSGGYREDFEQLLIDYFEQALSSPLWPANARANCLSKMMLDQGFSYDALDFEVITKSHCRTDEVDAIYLSIEKKWADLSPSSKRYSDEHQHYQRLERFLINRARYRNDLEQEFKIRERGAVSVDRCLILVALCIEHQRFEESEKWLDYASTLKQLSAKEIYQLESARIELLKAIKDYANAIEIQWSRFEEQEDTELLEDVLDSAQQLGQKQVWLDKGINYLSAKIKRNEQSQKNRQRAANLVSIYLANERLDSALDLSKTNLLGPDTLMAIARVLPTLDDTALCLIEKCTNLQLSYNGNKASEHAVSFLLEQYQELRSEAQHKRFQRTVKRIFSEPNNLRKTDFIKRLKAAFPSYF